MVSLWQERVSRLIPEVNIIQLRRSAYTWNHAEDLPIFCGHLQFQKWMSLLMMLYNSLNLGSGIIRVAKSAVGTSISLLGPSSELDLIAVQSCLADGADFRG